jgi:peptidoglycan hydrolase CwlO-like protein
MRYLIVFIILLFAAPVFADEVQDLSNQQLELANISQRLAGQIQYLDNLIDSLIKDKFTRQEQQIKVRDQFDKINGQLKALQAKPTPSEAPGEEIGSPAIAE